MNWIYVAMVAASESVDSGFTDSTLAKGLSGWHLFPAIVLVKAGLKPGLEKTNFCHCYADTAVSYLTPWTVESPGPVEAPCQHLLSSGASHGYSLKLRLLPAVDAW